MGRIILYGVLGFFVFGIIGIVVGSVIYSQNNETAVTQCAGIITLAGVILSVLFARWMDTKGEAKLEVVSSKPNTTYGIAGAVVGMWVGLEVAEFLNPSNNLPGYDLTGIAISIILCSWIGVLIGRWMHS